MVGADFLSCAEPSSYKNGIYKSADSYGKGTSILRINDFDNYGNLISENLLKVDLTPEEKESYKLGYNDIVVNRVNSLTHIGKSILWKHSNEIAVVYESNMMRIQPNESILYPDYLIKILQSENARNFFKKVAKQAVAQCSINQQDVKSLPIPLPPLPEQKKIAEILSTWDKAIETVEKLVANSQQQKQALMQQLLTGQKRLLDDNGVRFSEDWEFYKVKDIFISESLTAKEQNYPVYSVTKNGLINQADYFNKSVASEDTSKYRVVNRGRFVMSGLNFWMGSVDVHLEDFPVIVSPAYKVFSISKLTSPSFMKQFIKGSEFGKLLETSSVVGASVVRRNFSESIFNNYELFLPNLEEQEKIAQVLTLADREIDLYQQQLDKLKLEKNPSCNNYSQDKNG